MNPAEEIVNIWLQDVRNHFTMNNIVVPKGTRIVGKKMVSGGRGKEIDFFSTDGKSYFWTEVSVSPNPRLPKKSKKMQKLVGDTLKKFVNEKKKYLHRRFSLRTVRKQFVYSPNLFAKKSDEEKRYCKKLEKKGIKPISFGHVLEQAYGKLNFMGLDAPRQYLYILKKFGYEKIK